MSEQLLDRTDVIAVLEKVGGEAMTQSVAGDPFVYPGSAGGLSYGFL